MSLLQETGCFATTDPRPPLDQYWDGQDSYRNRLCWQTRRELSTPSPHHFFVLLPSSWWKPRLHWAVRTVFGPGVLHLPRLAARGQTAVLEYCFQSSRQPNLSSVSFLQKEYSNCNKTWRKNFTLTTFSPGLLELFGEDSSSCEPVAVAANSRFSVCSGARFSAMLQPSLRFVWLHSGCSVPFLLMCGMSWPLLTGLWDWTVMSQRFAAFKLPHHCLINLEWIVHCQRPRWKHSPVNSRIPPHSFSFNSLLCEELLETRTCPQGVSR